MKKRKAKKLKELMRIELPKYYSGVTDRSRNNQIQLIYTNTLPTFAKGNICLVGDVGVVVQPLIGAGLFNGYSNMRDLIVSIRKFNNLPTALKVWSDEQTRVAISLLELGEDLEDAFIWNTVDLAITDTQNCEDWWRDSVNIPDELSYFAN